MKTRQFGGVLVMGVVAVLGLRASGGAAPWPLPPSGARAGHAVAASYARLPLQFEANHGQADSTVRFLVHGRDYNLFLKNAEAVLALPAPPAARPRTVDPGRPTGGRQPAMVRLRFEGSNPDPEVAGLEPLPGVVNYFLGRDPAGWHTGIPTFARVKYTGVYPGVDVVFYGSGRELEYDFVVAPGADPREITLGVDGAASLGVDPAGDLVLRAGGGDIRLRKPLVYQEVDGVRHEVDGGYVARDGGFGFEVAAYDTRRPLILDPVLAYSSYFGGNGADYGYAIAVDAAGNTYFTGATNSVDFPTAGAAQPAIGGDGINCPSDAVPYRVCYDAFVTKLNAAGTAMVYSTYLGDPGDDQAYAIAVDSHGSAYITGQISLNSESLPDMYIYKHAWVAKLGPTGQLVYSDWFQPGNSKGQSIAVDSAGRAYVTGEAPGADFPTTRGALQPERGELIDAFVTVLDPTGSSLVYSTYLGGSGDYCGVCYSSGNGIAVDRNGMIYVTGQAAPSFPTTANAFQPDFGGFWRAFVTKIDPSRSGAAQLVYSTYLGGSEADFGKSIALDDAGDVYVAGSTQSEDFPTTAGAYDRTCGTDANCNATTVWVCDPVPPGVPERCHLENRADVFVAKLDLSRSGVASLVYSTYIGGSGQDTGSSIAVDGTGSIYVTGRTYSPDFPTAKPIQKTLGGDADVFVAKLTPAGSGLAFSTFLGGGGTDEGYGIALDSAGNAHVTGYTGSAAWPTANPLRDRSGSYEAFILMMTDSAAARFSVALPVVMRRAGQRTSAEEGER